MTHLPVAWGCPVCCPRERACEGARDHAPGAGVVVLPPRRQQHRLRVAACRAGGRAGTTRPHAALDGVGAAAIPPQLCAKQGPVGVRRQICKEHLL